MIITGIPFDEKLNIGVLSKVFERKRISNCYKYFWFQAILENIVEDKVVFTYDEILNQMIEDAWYMVTEFKCIRQITRLPEKVSPPDRGGES